ncbi:glycoside hydrolase family 9 protein [Chitinivibrio alkaliphilus]|uniref:Glycoside hydrolase, GH9 family n=1 Tax=Chitinivibrio alkaliphilus ACht1 TaxID=1313304 RepID=U7D7G6_9BACT|nr:glycoside hydrolase family 9 protein [Chitinivibrio alkaliphilus]ERP31047.1 glycoside hydrolase, GH9 family [Chitinivibrio alkaliphilus ACht1]
MKRVTGAAFCLVCILVSGITASDIYVRANEVGYLQGARKRAVVASQEDLTGSSWQIVSEDGAVLLTGELESRVHGKGAHSPFAYNHEVLFCDVTEAGTHTFVLEDGAVEKELTVSSDPYSSVVNSLLRWMKVQRSGTEETLDREVGHLGDSAVFVFRQKDLDKTSEWENWVEDEESKQVDMKGGWYTTGGDFRKFTNITAYTTYYLLKSYEKNPSLFDNADGFLGSILDEARWGLQYLLKTMPDDEDFIIQVGGFSHRGTRLPQDDRYDGRRNAYSAFSPPDMASTSAALALGASVFAEIDPDFAQECKESAQAIYARALEDDAQNAWMERGYALYKDDTEGDNFLIASMELYNLTGDASYLERAKAYSDDIQSAWWNSWTAQNMMGHSLIVDEHEPAKEYFMADINHFYSNAQNNVWGFPMDYGNGNLYSSKQIATAGLRYYQLTGENKFEELITDVLNYVHGLNNWGLSFIALEELGDHSVQNMNVFVYRLQTHLFPEGVPVLGPSGTDEHASGSVWILDDLTTNFCHPYNTDGVVFYDHMDDYMSTGARIDGAADAIYLLTLVTTLMAE